MFFSYSPIEGLLIELLEIGSLSLTQLTHKVSERRGLTTRQAIFQALKHLKKDEVVVETQKIYSLSSVWLTRLGDYTQKTLLHYKIADQPSINFLRLEEGEKISYSFKTFETTDIFWAHAFQVLGDNMPTSVPLLCYDPHDWFFLARPESESYLFNRLQEMNKRIYMIAGARTNLDLETAKFYNNIRTFYYASSEPLFKKSNYYLNVFNDFIIEVWLDPMLSKLIDDYYKQTVTINETTKNKLLEIITKKGKNKLVISKNSRKVQSTRVMFKKVFGLSDKDFNYSK